MNRSLANVLFGAFGAQTATGGARSATGLSVKSIAPEDLGIQVAYAQKMIVVPGYGMAVAESAALRCAGAGRPRRKARWHRRSTPSTRGGRPDARTHERPAGRARPRACNGHRLYEMDEINNEFVDTDVCLVIGANDVNPAARTDTASPIYGMPIINADQAKMTVVFKRSMAAGFAGVENELFYLPRTWMLFGDAKQSLQKLITEVKQA